MYIQHPRPIHPADRSNAIQEIQISHLIMTHPPSMTYLQKAFGETTLPLRYLYPHTVVARPNGAASPTPTVLAQSRERRTPVNAASLDPKTLEAFQLPLQSKTVGSLLIELSLCTPGCELALRVRRLQLINRRE